VQDCCGADANRATAPRPVHQAPHPPPARPAAHPGPVASPTPTHRSPACAPPHRTGVSRHPRPHHAPPGDDKSPGRRTAGPWPRWSMPRPGWPYPRHASVPVRVLGEPIRSVARHRSLSAASHATPRGRSGIRPTAPVRLIPESFSLTPFVVGTLPLVAGHKAHRTTSLTTPADGRGPQTQAAVTDGPGTGDGA